MFFQEVDSGQNCSFMGLDKHLNILSHIGAKLVNLFIILNRASILTVCVCNKVHLSISARHSRFSIDNQEDSHELMRTLLHELKMEEVEVSIVIKSCVHVSLLI